MSRTESATSATSCGWHKLAVAGAPPHMSFWSFDNGSTTWHQIFSTDSTDVIYSDSVHGSDVDLKTTGVVGTWFFWAVVRSGSTADVYIRYDGEGSLTHVGSFGANTTGNAIYLLNDGYGDTCQGTVRMTAYKEFSSTLSQAELLIESQYRTPQAANCVCYLPCTSVSGTDQSGGGNSFTITGTLTFNADEPTSMAEAPAALVGRLPPRTVPGQRVPRVPPFWPPSEIRRATAALGQSTVTSTIAATLAGLTADAQVQLTDVASIAATLPGLTAAANLTLTTIIGVSPPSPTLFGELNRFIPPFWPPSQTPRSTSVIVGSQVAATLPGLTAAINAAVTDVATIAATLPGLTAAAQLQVTVVADISATLPGLTAAGNIQVDNPITSTVAATLGGLTASVQVQLTDAATVAATLPGLTASATVVLTDAADLAATLPGLTAAVAAQVIDVAAVAAVLPGLTAGAQLQQTNVFQIAATLPGLIAYAREEPPSGPTRRAGAGGRRRRGGRGGH